MHPHHPRLSVLLPMLASAVASGCGGNVTNVDDAKSVNTPVGTAPSGDASAGTGTGGTSSGATTPSSEVAYDQDLCTGPTYEPLAGVTTTPAADYVELRDAWEHAPTEAPVVVAKAGTPCASASNKPKCEATFAKTTSTDGWRVNDTGMMRPRVRYLVATIGDQVKTVKSIEELRALVAPVETAKDAALLVTATGKYNIKCEGKKNAAKTPTGWRIAAESGHTCGAGAKLEGHSISVSASGEVTIEQTKLLKEGDPGCAIGRRPAGLVARAQHDTSDGVARFFLEAAYLEAASVHAFERLEAELRELAAPEALVVAARTSRDDEVRHTKMTTSLARRFGAESIDAPEIAPPPPRSAFEIALENAVEGCVRETYGALVAHWQANAASDGVVAQAMRIIADDETKHAALAWDVAAWLEPLLTVEARRAVEAARSEAIEALRRELATEPSPGLVALAGMPNRAHALELLGELDARFLRAA